MFFHVLVNIFGMFFVFRTTDYYKDVMILTLDECIFIKLSFSLLITVSIFVITTKLINFFVFICLILILLIVLCELISYQRQNQFHQGFEAFLDRVILYIRSGNSFRESLIKANHSSPLAFREKMNQIFEFVFFSQHTEGVKLSQSVEKIVKKLKVIEQSNQKVLQKMLSWRQCIQIESEFRQKSKIIKRKIQIQSFVISFLYLILAIYVLAEFNFYKIKEIFFLSSFLFLIGNAWILYSGRRMKWKI